MIEYFLEDVIILQPQKLLKGIFYKLILCEVEIQFSVEEDVIEEMRWEGGIEILNKIYHFLYFVIVESMFLIEELLEEIVEHFLEIDLEFMLDLAAVEVDHIVVGEVISTDEHGVAKIHEELSVVDCLDLPQVEYLTPFLLFKTGPYSTFGFYVLSVITGGWFKR